MKDYDVATAIRTINPDAQVVVRGDVNDIDACTIEWHTGTADISKADIKTKMAELKTAYDAKQYQRDRKEEYPTWQDQLDMQYHDLVDDTTTWKDAIQAVKDAHPKA